MKTGIIILALLVAGNLYARAVDLVTRDGTVYTSCNSIVRSDARITFNCASGLTELPVDELSQASLAYIKANLTDKPTLDGSDTGILGKNVTDTKRNTKPLIPDVFDVNVVVYRILPDGILAGLPPNIGLFIFGSTDGAVVKGSFHCRVSSIGDEYRFTDYGSGEKVHAPKVTRVPDNTPLYTFAPTNKGDSVWTCNRVEYRNVVVLDHNDHEVHISSDAETYDLALSDLSPELQARFNYNNQKQNSPVQKGSQQHNGMDGIGGL